MTLTADQLLEALTTLPPEKVAEAQARLQALAPVNSVAVQTENEEWDLIWTEMTYLLRKAGMKVISLPALLKSPAGGRMARKAFPAFLEYLKENFKPETKVDLVKTVQMAVTWVAKDVTRKGDALQPIRFLQRLENISAVVERNFPGWTQSGFLPLLVRRQPV